jgi:hypothetical protein
VSLPPATHKLETFVHIISSVEDFTADDDRFNLAPTEQAFEVEPPLQLARNLVVKNSVIMNGVQRLDGFLSQNVVFIGTRVRYEGGEVELNWCPVRQLHV